MNDKQLIDAYASNAALTCRHDKWLTVDDWEDLMLDACPDSYNDFDAITVANALRTMLDNDTSCIAIQAARESSVACYIHSTTGNLDVLEKIRKLALALRADEASISAEREELRLWWD